MAVLLVEDERSVQEMLTDALSEAGFDVVPVSTGNQALRELEDDAGRFRAIITDIKLGKGPTGWDLGRRARDLDSKIPVVYMSGDSAGDWSSLGVPNSIMVAKPFAPAQIITAVSALITEADPHRGS